MLDSEVVQNISYVCSLESTERIQTTSASSCPKQGVRVDDKHIVLVLALIICYHTKTIYGY